MNLLRQWLNGSIRRSGEQQLEQMAEQDPFLAEAMEGYRSMPGADHEGRLKAIDEKIGKRPGGRWIFLPPVFRIAAAVAVLIAAIAVFRTLNQPEEAAAPIAAESPNQATPAPAEESPAPEPAPSPEIARKEAAKPVPTAPAPSAPPPVNPSHDQKAGFSESIAMDIPAPAAEKSVLAPAAVRMQAEPEGALATRAVPMPTVPNALQGQVTDQEGNPVNGARVATLNDQINAFSDANGQFYIIADSIGQALHIDKEGFVPVSIQTKARMRLNISMTPAPVSEAARQKKASEKSLPTPVGGWPAWSDYLRRELRYPESARKAGIQGQVVLSFAIPADGTPANIAIIQSIHPDCDVEARRLLAQGPRWEAAFPGQQVVMVIPFRL